MSNLVKYVSSSELAQSKEVPALVKNTISQEDWDAMPTEERQGAIEFFREEMGRTTEGLDITFPRVKYPTSGAGVFEIPGAGSAPEYKSEISGVVVHKQVVRAWWPVGDPIANNPPKCSSPDGETPLPGPDRQAERCGECQHAQFGTGKEGSGQACKQRINVFLLRDVASMLEEIPTLLSVPPSQLKTFGDFAVQVRKAQSTLLSQATVFELIDARNKTGTPYKGLKLKLGRKLTYNEMVETRRLATMFKDQMERRGFVPADEEEAAGRESGNGSTARSDPSVIEGKAEQVPY